MRRFPVLAAIAIVLTLVVAGSAGAQTTTPTKYVFVAVDSVALGPYRLKVRGILENESAVVEKEVSFYVSTTTSTLYAAALEGCHRAALLSMEKPGAYRLELMPADVNGWPRCTLSRVTP